MIDEAWRRAAKSTGRRLWVDRAAWAKRGPEWEERIVTWLRGRYPSVEGAGVIPVELMVVE